MIWPTDSLQLAATKLKSRRIRLVVTIVITSLLFAVLFFLASFSEGTLRSLKDFGQEGYGSRYLVQANPDTSSIYGPNSDKEMIEHFKPIQADLVKQKKAAAKKLNLTYEEVNDQSLPLITPPGSNGDVIPNYGSTAIAEYNDQKINAIPNTDFASFNKVALAAGASHAYQGTMTYNQGNGSTTVLKDGKEQIDQQSSAKEIGPEGPKGMQTLTSIGWNSMDKSLMQPFVLPNQTLATGKDGSIATIAPASAAEEIAGLKALPATASSKEKLDRLVELRTKVAGKTAQLCYRNSASSSLLNQAVEQLKQIEANKNNKDYVKPNLIYRLPTEACGPVTIASDKRTAEEKKQDQNQQTFDKQFGSYVEPSQGIVTVRVIGLNPDLSYGASISAVGILSSLFTSTMGGRWLSPNDAILANPLASAIQGGNVSTANRSQSVYYAEFSTLKAMQDFIKQQTCDVYNGDTMNAVIAANSMPPQGQPATDCLASGKVFIVTPFGNSAGAIEEFRTYIWKAARVILIVILVIASLIMMGNVGKIIADSRRETSVFRALGAKRLDIAQIYLTYTLLICCIIAVVSLIIGSTTAYIINQRYSEELSINAILTYGAQDVHKQFSLYGFNPLYIAAIAGLVLCAGLLSATIPLIANTRRNPIRDMRDDT